MDSSCKRTLMSMYEPFGYYRLVTLTVAGIGVYLCLKMIATYPRLDDALSPPNTQVDEQKVEGVSHSVVR